MIMSLFVVCTLSCRAQLGTSTVLENGSDNLLLSDFILPALKCTAWTVTDLAALAQGSPQLLPALPLNELQAAMYQTAPVVSVFIVAAVLVLV
jgi:hypothetical protein